MTDQNSKDASSGGEIARLDGNAQLLDRGDLTGVVFADLVIDGVSAQQALFAGTLFRASVFRRCNFRRSDFEGTIFEDCLFEDCDFSVADFRSVEVARSQFVRCKFNEGAIRASTFAVCSFDHCELMLQNFEQNQVSNSHLRDCRFERSTVLHCNFGKVIFTNTDLADCTAQFHIFDACTFSASKLNAEAVGLTFGLTLSNLSSIELLWRGAEVPKPGSDDELIHDLATTYHARGWTFAAAILNLNFASVGRVAALYDIFEIIEASLKSPRPILDDDIAFLSDIVNWLSERGRLPFVAVVRGLDLCVTAAERSSKNDQLMRPLYHALKDAEYLELVSLDQTISKFAGSTTPLIAKFVFEEEPSISFRHWLNELVAAGILPMPEPEFRGAQPGSYIEIFCMTAGTLASALVCLGLVERIVDRLIYIRARGGILTSSKLPPAVRRRALQPIAAPSHALSKELQNYLGYLSSPHAPLLTRDAETFSERLKFIEVAPEDGYPLSRQE
jgi:uncharacterized protein YjbI with pentapeptide repeats